MSLEFDTPPMSRRERREREQMLLARGASKEQAEALSTATGIIDLTAPLTVTEPSAHPLAQSDDPVIGASEPAAKSEAIPHSVQPAANSVSFEELVSVDHEETNELSPAEQAEVSTVVELLFSTPTALAQDSPISIPIEPSTETGPIHWTDALSMPVDVDPTDPVTFDAHPSVTSDTNTIVLDEVPSVTELSTNTGEISLLVTGTIHLPTELTETGAHPDMLDSIDVELNEDIADELPISTLSPKSAMSAVNSSVEPPSMVASPPKERLSTSMIVAISVGGAAGVVLIALAVGGIFRLF